MGTYSKTDFENIAVAIELNIEQVASYQPEFEAAARWYRSDTRRPERTAPSKMQEKLGRVARNASRLLNSLGITVPNEAFDGLGDAELVDALVLADEPNEEPHLIATRRIGRLSEIAEATAAAAELERRAKTATVEVSDFGRLTVKQGNSGDNAVNNWIATMMSLYRAITGKAPATSVTVPGQPSAGIASGPLIRFLRASGQPLGLEYFEDALRSRVRAILKMPQHN
jgi:hypothetical protein